MRKNTRVMLLLDNPHYATLYGCAAPNVIVLYFHSFPVYFCSGAYTRHIRVRFARLAAADCAIRSRFAAAVIVPSSPIAIMLLKCLNSRLS
jgi:hypothetical protein